jgi:hypothetical protein
MLEEQIEKLTGSNEELVSVIKDLISKLESGEVTPKPSARTPATKTKDEPKAAAKSDNIKPLKKEPVSEEPKAETAKTKATKDDARKALLSVKEEFDMDEMYAVIAEAADGATNMSEVKEEHYQPIVEACNIKLIALAEAA